MRGRLTHLAGLAVCCAVAVSACGSSSPSGNGVAAKSPAQILAQATTAIDRVNSVRVVGAIAGASAADAIKLDLSLVSGKGATGSLSENGRGFKLITVGDNAYINGSPEFWKQFGGSAAVQLLEGKWLKAPATSGDFATFGSLTNLHKLIAGLLKGHGALTKGATAVVNGQKVIALKDTSKGGTLYVATTGQPYPIEIVKSGTGGGKIDFSNFDRPVALAAPAQSIDIDKLKAG